jgi:glycosyltransferase involved in cell wall biosynthesis
VSKTSKAAISVLHVASPGEVGGLETVLRALAVAQRRSGHRVLVVAAVEPADRQHPLVTALSSEGVEAVQLEVSARAYLRERQLVRDLAREWRPDVIHTHGFRSDVVHLATARRLRLAVVTTQHGYSHLGSRRTRFYELIQRYCLRRFDAVVAVSNEMYRQLADRWLRDGPLYTIQNAWTGSRPTLDRISARKVLRLDSETFVVGWVGRLVPVKGAALFLEAVARLNGVDLTACVVGGGPERDKLEWMAQELGIQAKTRFVGTIDGAARLFPAFDVFVLSSSSEGTPIALFEAMAARVPIVATSVGGVPDIISSCEAVLVPPSDPDAIARGVREIKADPAKTRERVQAADARLRSDFSPKAWLRRYDSVYRQAIERNARNRPGGHIGRQRRRGIA